MIYPWLQTTWQQLCAPHAQLPHALLFSGPSGLGKRELAEWLAARLLCGAPAGDGQACGICTACRLRLSGNHPDLLRIVPESELALQNSEDAPEASKKTERTEKAKSSQILIEQVRDLQQALTVTGHQSERRVILIAPAEAMNIFTANALLKILEEPPKGCTFILLSDEPLRLLPTILSRCQQWRISPPNTHTMQDWQDTNPHIDAALLAISGGMPLAAQRMAEHGEEALLSRFIRDISALDDPLALASQWETWLKSKESLATGFVLPKLIDWMQRWVTDLATLRLGGKVRYFPQCQSTFERLSQHGSVASTLNCYNEFGQIRKASLHPLNIRLTIEDMLMRYMRATSRPQK